MPGFDFGNVAQSARDWVGLRADQENLAQNRWTNQEQRTRADEANQYNRDESQSQADMYARLRQNNPELFGGIDRSVQSGGLAPDQMAATNPTPAPAAATPTATTPATSAPATSAPATATPATPATPTASARQPLVPLSRLVPLGRTTDIYDAPIGATEDGGGAVRGTITMTAAEREAAYTAYVRGVNDYNAGRISRGRLTELRDRAVAARMIARDHQYHISPLPANTPVEGMSTAEQRLYRRYNRVVLAYNEGRANIREVEAVRREAIQAGIINAPATPAAATSATSATSATPTSYGSVPEVNAAARGADEIARSGVIERLFPGTRVTSASRTPQHNAAVDGVPDSMHITDEALDIVPPPGVDHTAFAQQLSQQLGIPFTEIIPYDNGNHLHVGWGRNGGGTGTTQVASAQAGTPQIQGGSLNGFDIRGLLGDTDPTTDTHFTGPFQDASISQHDTREMGLQRAVINDDLRRAEVAAAHGRPDIARASFLTALQGQAAYVQAYHMQLYNAANRGNMDAAATLLADMQGYPPGRVRFRPTDEHRTRFVPQVRNDQDQWVNTSEVPTTKTELLASLGSFVGIAADASQAETQRAIVTSLIENNVRLQIADMEHRDRVLNAITNAQTTIYNGELQREIAAGRAEVYTDSANGQAYVVTRRVGPNGQIVLNFTVVRNEQQNLPSTNNEHRQVTVSTAQRVNGVGGLAQ